MSPERMDDPGAPGPEPGAAASAGHGNGRRKPGDWAALLGLGPLTVPFLLRNTYGGSRAARQALLETLALTGAALPGLGGWSADSTLLRLVVDHVLVAKPATIVELGSGISTLVVARALQLAGIDATFVSLDHDPRFSARTRRHLLEHGLDADLRHAPLRPAPGGWPGLWYACADLPEQIDFLLIDGPPWTIHPLVRGAAETLFGRIVVGGTLMLDDAARPGERIVARRWRSRWPGFDFERRRAGKGTLVGRRMR